MSFTGKEDRTVIAQYKHENLEATNDQRREYISAFPCIEIKLFTGRIPRSFGEVDIEYIFKQFGAVKDIYIIRDRDSGVHKGCAFVRMASITGADAAIRSLNNSKILEPSLGPLQVKYAFGECERLGLTPDNGQAGVDQVKLFVGSLPKEGITESDIQAIFSKFGKVDEVFIMRDDHQVSKGCAFVRLAFKEDAFHAMAELNEKFIMPGSVRPIEVRFAESRRNQKQSLQTRTECMSCQPMTKTGSSEVSGWIQYCTAEGRSYYYDAQSRQSQWKPPSILTHDLCGGNPSAMTHGVIGSQTHGPPGANVFIFHVPNAWEEKDLIAHFCHFGKIVSARIAADRSSGRRLGFGFVSYGAIESAIAAVSALNGLSVSGKRLKVTIKRGEERFAETGQRGSYTLMQAHEAMPTLIEPKSVYESATPSRYEQRGRLVREQTLLRTGESRTVAAVMQPHIPSTLHAYKPAEIPHEWHPSTSAHIGIMQPTFQVQAPTVYGIVAPQQRTFTFHSRHFGGPTPTAAH